MNGLLMRLFFKFGWILVFLSTSCNYDLFHHSNRLIFHDVFVYFTTLYIHLIAHATKVITLQLHKVHMLPSNYMYKQFNNTYIPICIYLPTYLHTICLATYYVLTYVPPTYVNLHNYYIPTYLLFTYLLCTYIHTPYVPTYYVHTKLINYQVPTNLLSTYLISYLIINNYLETI